jgi:hypothetical protein
MLGLLNLSTAIKELFSARKGWASSIGAIRGSSTPCNRHPSLVLLEHVVASPRTNRHPAHLKPVQQKRVQTPCPVQNFHCFDAVNFDAIAGSLNWRSLFDLDSGAFSSWSSATSILFFFVAQLNASV